MAKVKSKRPEQFFIDPPQPISSYYFEKHIVDELETIIFDADGVLWLGDEVIPGSPEFVHYLHAKGKTLIVLTNNTTKTKEETEAKFQRLGFSPALSSRRLVTPSIVAADYCEINNVHEKGRKIFLIGEHGLLDEFQRKKLPVFGVGVDPDRRQIHPEPSQPYMLDFHVEPQKGSVGAVVVAYDRHFDYVKLLKAANYLQDPNCYFVATNLDETTPAPGDLVVPDAGPNVEALRTASARDPNVICGKPSTAAYDFILRNFGVRSKSTLMIGDRLNTDIAFGREFNFLTILVQSGVHNSSDIEAAINAFDFKEIPHFTAPCLGALVPESFAKITRQPVREIGERQTQSAGPSNESNESQEHRRESGDRASTETRTPEHEQNLQ